MDDDFATELKCQMSAAIEKLSLEQIKEMFQRLKSDKNECNLGWTVYAGSYNIKILLAPILKKNE